MKMKAFAFAAILTSGFWMSPASAGIVFTLGNNPQPNEANILFAAPQTGATITGEVDHTGVDAIFKTLTGQTLNQKAQGQADIFNLAGTPLTSIDFTLESGFGFLDFIMNPQNGTGDATVTVHTQNAVFTYTLGNGQNFLTIVATGGDVMTGISLTMSAGGGFDDFKQPRISGVCEIGAETCAPVTIVPEPGVLSLLGLGLALLGVAGIRRRRV